jgi:hypothetical protein
MKTKEFIEMLKKADPSGEAHVRMNGGIPFSVEHKEGYWDGPYSYIDEEGNYVYSIENSKVDVYSIDIMEFVDRNFDLHTPGHNTWEDIEKKFKFKLGGYVNNGQRNERELSILKEAKEAFDELKDMHERMLQDEIKDMKSKAELGWKWFQNKDVDKDERPNMHKYYTWKIFDDKNKEQGSNVYMTSPVQYSGLWEKLDNNVMTGYYQWIYKNKI